MCFFLGRFAVQFARSTGAFFEVLAFFFILSFVVEKSEGVFHLDHSSRFTALDSKRAGGDVGFFQSRTLLELALVFERASMDSGQIIATSHDLTANGG